MGVSIGVCVSGGGGDEANQSKFVRALYIRKVSALGVNGWDWERVRGGTYRDNRFTAQTMHSHHSNKAYRRHSSNIICEQLTYIKLIHWKSYARGIIRPRISNRISILFRAVLD